ASSRRRPQKSSRATAHEQAVSRPRAATGTETANRSWQAPQSHRQASARAEQRGACAAGLSKTHRARPVVARKVAPAEEVLPPKLSHPADGAGGGTGGWCEHSGCAEMLQCVTLWVGEGFGAVERACLRSVVRQGHRLTLYCYREPIGIPDGVELQDASQVLPATAVMRHRRGSVAPFSDWFRYELLKRGLGTWID